MQESIGSAGTRRRIEHQRVILILSKAGSVSDQLIDAIEREFPWVVVEQVEAVEAACMPFGHPVSLILLDKQLVREAEAAAPELLRVHPAALTAIIQPGEKEHPVALEGLAASPLVRSVLPMDLRLDIWLSIIRLMLCGGEYLPPAAFTRIRARTSATNPAPPEEPQAVLSERDKNLVDLTLRETQILEMVARGLQNKLIAVEFGLSEHTVKVHLHNIIRKLGVHNRTEAAARFHSFSATIGA